MKAAADHVLTLFPFEKTLYDKAGITSTYVGHPLADILPLQGDILQARKTLRLDVASPVIAVLPGSRLAEIDHLALVFIKAMSEIEARLPGVQFLLPFINQETRRRFEQALSNVDNSPQKMYLMFGHAHEAMTAANVVLLASGTASLEAALIGRPMVIAYKMPRLSWLMLRHKAYLPWVGLPNILAKETLVPEFLQKAATPQAIADAVLDYFNDKKTVNELKFKFSLIHNELRQGAANRAAGVVEHMLAEATSQCSV